MGVIGGSTNSSIPNILATETNNVIAGHGRLLASNSSIPNILATETTSVNFRSIILWPNSSIPNILATETDCGSWAM